MIAHSMGISIAAVSLEDPVILAPMSGVSDLPFRRLVKRLGAGLVVSEMLASEAGQEASRKAAYDAAIRRGMSKRPQRSSTGAAHGGAVPRNNRDASRAFDALSCGQKS